MAMKKGEQVQESETVTIYEVHQHSMLSTRPKPRYFYDIEAAERYAGTIEVNSVVRLVLRPTTTRESKPIKSESNYMESWSSTVTTFYEVVSRTPLITEKAVTLREAKV